VGLLKLLRSLLNKLPTTGVFILLLAFLALRSGTGYETTEVNHEILVITPQIADFGGRFGLPEIGIGHFVYICNVNVSFNPFLYPLSFLSGKGNASSTSRESSSPLLVNKKYEALDSAEFSAVFPEFLRNLPYIVVIGFLMGLLAEKLYCRIYAHIRAKT